MSDLGRFARHLATVLAREDPSGVHRPVTVSELRRFVLPYRQHRNALGLVSSDDYELLVLRLSAEEDGFVRTFPPDVADRCRAELETPNPDLDLVEVIGDATVQFGAASLARLLSDEGGPATASAPPRADLPEVALSASPLPPPGVESETSEDAVPVMEESEPVRVASEPEEEADAGEIPFRAAGDVESAGPRGAEPEPPAAPSCGSCAMTLPGGRPVVYCPFCGDQLRAVQCMQCGTEVEPGWRYCITCGHPAGPGGARA